MRQPALHEGFSTTASDASPTEKEEPSGGNLLNLFGRRRKSAGAVAAAEEPTARESIVAVGPYLTSVALGCDLISHLCRSLTAEGALDSTDTAAVCQRFWNAFGMRFPRADLIQPNAEGLDPSLFEKYVKMAGGIDSHLAGCLEDSMAALASVGRELLAQAQSKLGPRAQAIFEESVKPFVGKVQVTWPADFLPRTWVSQWSDKVS